MLLNECLPEIVIGGAPKCGTSSLFYQLIEHPEIIGSDPKESFFFMDLHHPRRNLSANLHEHGIEAYGPFFGMKDGHGKFRLDATTHYLYSDTALSAFTAGPRPYHVYFLLREPATRVYSSFQYTLNNTGRIRGEISFPQMLDLMMEQRVDEIADMFTHEGSLYSMKHEVQWSCYANYLSKWINALGEDRVHVVLFEDFIKKPTIVLGRMASDLGIDEKCFHNLNLRKDNQTLSIRNRAIHSRLLPLVKKLPGGRWRKSLRGLYYKIQDKSAQRSNEDIEAIACLKKYYRPYNKRLEELCRCDLSVWQ